MKDARHHLKKLQKKTIQSLRKELNGINGNGNQGALPVTYINSQRMVPKRVT